MSSTYISVALRRQVCERAANRCEYCGIHEEETGYGCEVDHILSEKHGGPTIAENLALACFYCNRNKGSDIGAIRSLDDPILVRFFNPRTDSWSEHFEHGPNHRIIGLTDVGRVTVQIFGFNDAERLIERRIAAGDD